MRLSDFDDWARSRHGLIVREPAKISEPAWRRALLAGRFEQIHPGVARMHGTADTPEQRIAAAVLGVPESLASHRSAARLWGIPRPDDDPVDVIVGRNCGVRRLDGVVLHRPRDRARLHPSRRFSIRCTNVLRTLADLGAVDEEGLHDAVGHAIATRLVDLAALETAAREHAGRGRSGAQALRRTIGSWSIDQKPADSILEPAMRRLIERHHLPAVEFHPTIEGCEVDFRFTGTALIIECDGWAYHGLERRQFERDRDAVLSAAGWIVLRFTYRAITNEPSRTARRIRENLERWAGRDAPDAP